MISLIKILFHGGGSIVQGTVNTKKVVKATGTPMGVLKATISDAKATGASKVFGGISGRKNADATGKSDSELRAALVAAFGPGPKGGEVNVAAAAKGLGKSPSTIKRWLTGKSTPKAENRKELLAKARQAASTKKGRAVVVESLKAGPAGAKISKYGAWLKVQAIQGPAGYERDRSIRWDLPPELVDDALAAYTADGDKGFADFMADYANTDYYGNIPDWNVFSWGDVDLDPK
ncbi:hypothetical protein [Nocardia tengchongensis]|uniref:hypothetical protein n=1 Tax=Nocardia tengchongensis TaxID=2055889 RepID=UPI003659AA7A